MINSTFEPVVCDDMISFFKRLRESALSSSRARKYLLYAAGEIALVVIGILIAVQINNWNEGRKEVEREQKILVSLQREISANITELNSVIDRHKYSGALTRELLTIFSAPGSFFDVIYLDSLVENASSPHSFTPQLGVVKSVISTGEINYLQDEQVVDFVSTFEDENAKLMRGFSRLVTIWGEHLWPRENLYIRRLNRAQENKKSWFEFTLPPSRHVSDYERFFADVVLENTYMLMLYDHTYLIIREEILLEQMKEILTLVESRIVEND